MRANIRPQEHCAHVRSSSMIIGIGVLCQDDSVDCFFASILFPHCELLARSRMIIALDRPVQLFELLREEEILAACLFHLIDSFTVTLYMCACNSYACCTVVSRICSLQYSCRGRTHLHPHIFICQLVSKTCDIPTKPRNTQNTQQSQ